MIVIKSVSQEPDLMRQFIAFGQQLYSPDEIIYPDDELRQVLTNEHPLSDEYHSEAYIGFFNEKIAIRGVLFWYGESRKAFLGYFEAVNNQAVMNQFTDTLLKRVKELGGKSLIGPVQASFWQSYRMKLSNFTEVPFTGEPHNLNYYSNLWEQAGFQLVEHYASNFYQSVIEGFKPDKLKHRYDQFLARNISFVTPRRKDWEDILPEVFKLLSRLYRRFPLYHAISFDQFSKLIGVYKPLLDFSMVRLAYDVDQLVGFVIVLPDYGRFVYQPLTLWRLLKLLKIRRKTKRYIVLYLGADSDYLGLGSALMYPIVTNIMQRKAETIGALIHQGKVTNNYVSNMQKNRTLYGLYQRHISD